MTALVIIGSILITAGLIANEKETNYREDKELFKANFVQKFTYGFLTVGLCCLISCILFII